MAYIIEKQRLSLGWTIQTNFDSIYLFEVYDFYCNKTLSIF